MARLEELLILTILIMSFSVSAAMAETPHGQASIEKIAGYNWYYWPKPKSDSCILWLGGGQTLPTYVTVNPYRLESLNTMRFIDDLAKGYSMLALGEGEIMYRTDSKLVSKVCTWIRDSGYKYAFVVGYSTGGNALAYELTIPENSEVTPDGAIIISSMLNWEQMIRQHGTSSGIDLYESAQDARYVRRSVLLMYGDAAWFWHQGEDYYSNLPGEGWYDEHWFYKEWRLMKGVEHEVFTLEKDGSYDAKPLAIAIEFIERVRASSLKNIEGPTAQALHAAKTNETGLGHVETSYPQTVRAYSPFHINVTIPDAGENEPGEVAVYDPDMQSFVTVTGENSDNATSYSLRVVCVANQSLRRLVAVAVTDQDHSTTILGISRTMQIDVEDRPSLRVAAGVASLGIEIDGRAYTTDDDGILDTFLENGNHTVKLPETVEISPGKRLLFAFGPDHVGKNVIELSLDKDILIQAGYKTQYLLTANSDYGVISGDGWYDENSTAIVTVDSTAQTPPGGEENLAVFKGWSDETNSRSLRHEVYMDSAEVIAAKWAYSSSPQAVEVNTTPVWPFVVASVIVSIVTVIIYTIDLRMSKTTSSKRW